MNGKSLIAILSLLPLSAVACEKPQVTGYDEVGCLSEGLAIVRQNDKYGFVDKVGQVVIPLMYDDVRPYSEGLAGVQKDNKWGVCQ